LAYTTKQAIIVRIYSHVYSLSRILTKGKCKPCQKTCFFDVSEHLTDKIYTLFEK